MTAACLDLRMLARVLGGDVVGHQVIAPGPGHTAADRSLSIRLSATAPDGFLAHSHSGDDWRQCRDHVRAKLGLTNDPAIPPPRPVERSPAPPRDDGAANSQQAIAIWREAVDPRDTLVEVYLATRSLGLPADIAGSVVRFHPACPWRLDGKLERLPSMITAFRGISSDKLIAIQRTAIAPNGTKIKRAGLGPVGGAAIKIDADEDVRHGLHVGEGFETCLAARHLGFRPTWAVGSANAIAQFPVLPGIEALTLFAETDRTGANKRAIATCGQRWSEAGLEVNVVTPRNGGDVNDALKGRSEA